MRYIIFSRVSGKDQTTENQLWACKNYVESIKKEGDSVTIFNENVQSTRLKASKRAVLQEMLSFIRKGDTLVVYKFNRIARDSQELINIYRSDILERGVEIISLKEQTVDKSLICIYAMVSEIERENISKTTKTSLLRKQSEMEKVGTTWYGYKTDETKLQKRENVRSSGKPYLLVTDETEHQQVQLMVKWHDEGLSYGKIALELEAIGHKNRNGNRIGKSTILRILRRIKGAGQTQTVLSSL